MHNCTFADIDARLISIVLEYKYCLIASEISAISVASSPTFLWLKENIQSIAKWHLNENGMELCNVLLR